jgi:hypothetical protein
MRMPKEGDFQMSKGRIGERANLASYQVKRQRWRMETMRRM